MSDAVYRRGGYNKWASTNQLIVLYPQTTASIGNPEGCFDWFGFNQPLATSDFARKTGQQISVFRKMLDRLAQGGVAGPGAPDKFETPKQFSIMDRTSTLWLWSGSPMPQLLASTSIVRPPVPAPTRK